jgi:hypothetical protein
MFADRQNKRAWLCKGHKRVRLIEPEIITEESPVFRLERADVIPISTSSAIHAINEVAVAVGVRTKIDKTQRHKTPSTHNFRKTANTAFVKAGIKPVVVEKLLGHKTGLQDNYLRLTDEDLLSEYVKAVDLLTIGDEDMLRRENERLKLDKADMAVMKQTIAKQAETLDLMQKTFGAYAKKNPLPPIDDERLKWLAEQKARELHDG